MSCSSDFALYLEDYLMDKCHIFRKWDSVHPNFDLKINIGQRDPYFMV